MALGRRAAPRPGGALARPRHRRRDPGPLRARRRRPAPPRRPARGSRQRAGRRRGRCRDRAWSAAWSLPDLGWRGTAVGDGPGAGAPGRRGGGQPAPRPNDDPATASWRRSTPTARGRSRANDSTGAALMVDRAGRARRPAHSWCAACRCACCRGRGPRAGGAQRRGQEQPPGGPGVRLRAGGPVEAAALVVLQPQARRRLPGLHGGRDAVPGGARRRARPAPRRAGSPPRGGRGWGSTRRRRRSVPTSAPAGDGCVDLARVLLRRLPCCSATSHSPGSTRGARAAAVSLPARGRGGGPDHRHGRARPRRGRRARTRHHRAAAATTSCPCWTLARDAGPRGGRGARRAAMPARSSTSSAWWSTAARSRWSRGRPTPARHSSRRSSAGGWRPRAALSALAGATRRRPGGAAAAGPRGDHRRRRTARRLHGATRRCAWPGRRAASAALERFPLLARSSRRSAPSCSSGGEQQLLQVACAWCADPRVLVLDAPTTGLADDVAELVRQLARETAADGAAVLWLDQDAAQRSRRRRLDAGRRGAQCGCRQAGSTSGPA